MVPAFSETVGRGAADAELDPEVLFESGEELFECGGVEDDEYEASDRETDGNDADDGTDGVEINGVSTALGAEGREVDKRPPKLKREAGTMRADALVPILMAGAIVCSTDDGGIVKSGRILSFALAKSLGLFSFWRGWSRVRCARLSRG